MSWADRIADWLDLMPAQVVVQRLLGHDSYSRPTYASPANYDARVTYKQRRITNAQGEEVVSRGEAWLATIDPITARDLITLPDGSNPLILEADLVSDEVGPLYTKFYFA